MTPETRRQRRDWRSAIPGIGDERIEEWNRKPARGHNFHQGRRNGKVGRREEFPSKETVFLGHKELGDRAGSNN